MEVLRYTEMVLQIQQSIVTGCPNDSWEENCSVDR